MNSPLTYSTDPLQALPRTVHNQAPSLRPVDLFQTDLPLREALAREGSNWGTDLVAATGAAAGTELWSEHTRRADRNEPVLRPYDRYGNRVDEVELDPSWFWLLHEGIRRGLHSMPWTEARPGAHAVRAANFLMFGENNLGVSCPISMTYAVVPALRDGSAELAAEWEPRLTSTDPATAAIAGMAMTERQGGSDVRANLTRAIPAGDGEWELWGHKWFCSYPPCDVFLVLAQTTEEGGAPSCFLVERGPGMEFQRLKEKLGTRSLPSAEVEFRGIRARLVGEEGRGVPAIVRMVNHTRLDCLIGGAGSMRHGVREAVHHARHRTAFGARLVDQPAMANVLADLALESEAATATALRVARAYDDDTPDFRRLATAVEKYWVCKRAAAHAAESLECLGGNGYVEESGLPQLFRDAPLCGIWEGSGNVAALDVLRAIEKEPGTLPAFLAECQLATGGNAALDAHLAAVGPRVAALADGARDAAAQWHAQFGARALVEDLAVALQASLLVRHAPAAVSDAFCAARLGNAAGRVYGTLPTGVDTTAILERALPA